MELMATLGDRILEAIRYAPLDDDVLARRLGVAQRQSVNQAARRLEVQGLLRRIPGPGGKIVNALPAQPTYEPTSVLPPSSDAASVVPQLPRTPMHSRQRFASDRITEDDVKEAVRAHLAADGFVVEVAWGRTPGIDIVARHVDGRRYVIEAKAEVGIAGAQQHNYFVGMLGELIQRMDDPEATYAIALPDNRQYRGLADRLPGLAKRRMTLAVFWVRRTADGFTVEEEPRPV